MKYAYFLLAGLGLFTLTAYVHAVEPEAVLKEAARQAAAQQALTVQVQAVWKHTPLLVRSVRFRPGKKIAVAYPSKEAQNSCRGVLVREGAAARIPLACLQRPNDAENRFELLRVSLEFANGNRFVYQPEEWTPKGEWAYFQVPQPLTRGLPAAK